MAAVSSLSDEAANVTIQITNLRRREQGNSADPGDRSTSQDATRAEEGSFTLPNDSPLSALWDKIADAGFDRPVRLENGKQGWHGRSEKIVLEPYEVFRVTAESSGAAETIGLDETLLAFANRRYGTPLQLNIDEHTSTHGGQCECIHDSGGLKITFLRTTRMPDDDKLHQLPAALGTFPLHNVSSYTHMLPDKVVREGGVFMPMWQREAMWMSFESTGSRQYALRISIGRINAVSGTSLDETRKDIAEGTKMKQDYVVVPGQRWLDGICVGPGIVRQFVAMPLGSGYTVEGQKIGKEIHGGLTIEVVPAFQFGLRSWVDAAANDGLSFNPYASYSNPLGSHLLREPQTPRQLGLSAGAILHAYPAVAYKRVPCSVADITHHHDGTVLAAVNAEQMIPQYHDIPLPTMGSGPIRRTHGHMADVSAEAVAWSTDSPLTLGMTDVQTMNSSAAAPRTVAEATATVTTKDLQSMGLAAGGKLIQDVYEDRNSSNIWNTAASRLVNIHILDPASCEAVTHTVPPPPPMDAETYAKLDLPLFVLEEKPDERLEGGDFSEVKSVSAMDKQGGIKGEQALDPTKPTQCGCGVRLCDCVVRPCGHQLCHVCVKQLDPTAGVTWSSAQPAEKCEWKCPLCKNPVAYVAGFSAPMNLPGEETVKKRVPVHVLGVRDGRTEFKSVQKSRM